MPSLETPPNSAPTHQPTKVRTGRFGELDEHELIHLLDTLDDERSKARFRESIYISVIIYLAIAWFLFYGPRVLFHQPRLISPVEVLKNREKQLTFLDEPKNLPRPTPRPIPEKSHAQPLDQKTLQQLRAMRKPETPAPQPVPAPPTQATPTPPTPQPPPPAPQPTQQALVEAPRPAPPRPTFANPNQSAGDAIRRAAQDAAHDRGSGDYSNSPSGGRQGMDGTAEILSDTQGVDFGPYLRRILSDIKRNWIPLIPEEARPPLNKQGETLIRFTILPDGRIKPTADGMVLDGPSGDAAIDRACWGGITGVGQFPPLPAAFKGPNLELRVDFFTNKPIP